MGQTRLIFDRGSQFALRLAPPLRYFERSLEIYGPHTGTYYRPCAITCSGRTEQAEPLACKVVQADPNNGEARELLASLARGKQGRVP